MKVSDFSITDCVLPIFYQFLPIITMICSHGPRKVNFSMNRLLCSLRFQTLHTVCHLTLVNETIRENDFTGSCHNEEHDLIGTYWMVVVTSRPLSSEWLPVSLRESAKFIIERSISVVECTCSNEDLSDEVISWTSSTS